MPHEALGLAGLDKFSALRLALSVKRARRRWREHQVSDLLRGMDGNKDPMGVGRVIAMLAAGEIGK